LSQYRTRMRQHYASGLSKEEINNLQITKAQLYSKFIDPRTRQPPVVTKRRICMDWCTYQPWKDNWRKRWFMVFDKPPCNNVEVPQYFLRKLWAEFELGYHVNYFDITEFQGVGLGSAQDRPQAHRNPLRGPPAPRREPNPPPQPPGLGGGLDQILASVGDATRHLLRHTTFVSMSSQSRDQPSPRSTGGGPSRPSTGGGPSIPTTGGGPSRPTIPTTGGGPSRPTTGGTQDDPCSSTGQGVYQCPHCGHVCHGATQESATDSFLQQVSYCFI